MVGEVTRCKHLKHINKFHRLPAHQTTLEVVQLSIHFNNNFKAVNNHISTNKKAHQRVAAARLISSLHQSEQRLLRKIQEVQFHKLIHQRYYNRMSLWGSNKIIKVVLFLNNLTTKIWMHTINKVVVVYQEVVSPQIYQVFYNKMHHLEEQLRVDLRIRASQVLTLKLFPQTETTSNSSCSTNNNLIQTAVRQAAPILRLKMVQIHLPTVIRCRTIHIFWTWLVSVFLVCNRINVAVTTLSRWQMKTNRIKTLKKSLESNPPQVIQGRRNKYVKSKTRQSTKLFHATCSSEENLYNDGEGFTFSYKHMHKN